jgi:hypothetical protein
MILSALEQLLEMIHNRLVASIDFFDACIRFECLVELGEFFGSANEFNLLLLIDEGKIFCRLFDHSK